MFRSASIATSVTLVNDEDDFFAPQHMPSNYGNPHYNQPAQSVYTPRPQIPRRSLFPPLPPGYGVTERIPIETFPYHCNFREYEKKKEEEKERVLRERDEMYRNAEGTAVWEDMPCLVKVVVCIIQACVVCLLITGITFFALEVFFPWALGLVITGGVLQVVHSLIFWTFLFFRFESEEKEKLQAKQTEGTNEESHANPSPEGSVAESQAAENKQESQSQEENSNEPLSDISRSHLFWKFVWLSLKFGIKWLFLFSLMAFSSVSLALLITSIIFYCGNSHEKLRFPFLIVGCCGLGFGVCVLLSLLIFRFFDHGLSVSFGNIDYVKYGDYLE
ncbi:hypothetical protein DASC09_055380 [Saccharomycopsis crataegensis]|uniref:Transmembrane protein n=1 Tax=Saccharomycopsis crataegensis TaxID=43959 RepID=A0AAV5QU04_9ASCO|nr:hypothetical protein DASC09_055380 [Saccharomycopsis crataegensis]